MQRSLEGPSGAREVRPYKRFTLSELEFLRSSYPFFTDEELGKFLNRTPSTIRKHRQLLQLSRVGLPYKQLAMGTPVVVLKARSEFSDTTIHKEII